MTIRTLILGVLVAAASVGCATTQNSPADTRAASNSLDASAARVDPTCVKDTGTRIKRSENQPCSTQPGRTYTQRELQDTGRFDMAEALRTLDPRLQ
jgi:hypothetical protein